MAAFTDDINLFDRINLAACAMRRAKEQVFDEQRFYREYKTARAWNKYKCVITTNYSYVDDN